MIKILVIDDNKDNLISMGALISFAIADSTLFTADNGRDGIALALAYDPDVILLDIIMPEMDGYEVCRLLKQNKRVCDIPVVFLTSLKVDKKGHVKALATGAEAFLSKPIDESELTAQIRAMVKIKSASRQKSHEQLRLSLLVSERTKELEQNQVEMLILLNELKAEIESRKQIESELILAKEKAEENNRLKSALLNNLSHEIRTPMNAIMGFSSLMKQADTEEKSSYAEIIYSSSNQLLSQIDKVMMLSRLQSEKTPLNEDDFSPIKLIADICAMFSHPTQNKGLAIFECVPDHLKNVTIHADSGKIRQVLTNFVSNAMKYTFEGSIELGFELKGASIEFFVKDTGMGVQDREKLLIFDTFYRGEQAISLAIRGTGLGLNIAKELVELMEGEIGVQSELNSGSRFYFKIPFKNSILKRPTNLPSVNTNPGIKNFRILIAEDEHFNFKYLEILLKGKVKKVDLAVNGQEAIEKASQHCYNLVLMDLKMPVLDGIEATKILKAKYPALPIIAQTACMLPEEKEIAFKAGFDDFIVKPIDKDKVLEVINKYS